MSAVADVNGDGFADIETISKVKGKFVFHVFSGANVFVRLDPLFRFNAVFV